MANETYVLAMRLHLNGKLYEVGESIDASAFAVTDEKTGMLLIAPKTVEQVIDELRAANVLKLPVEMQQAQDVQTTLAAKQAEIEALQAQLAEMQAQATALPASAPQRKGATGKGVDVAPAAEEAPLAE